MDIYNDHEQVIDAKSAASAKAMMHAAFHQGLNAYQERSGTPELMLNGGSHVHQSQRLNGVPSLGARIEADAAQSASTPATVAI